MAIGLIVYVLGFYIFFCHAAYIAPKKWTDVNFRERWKFMLTRWRPDVWYWGCVVMTRNLLVAFAGVIHSDPRVQLVYVVVVVILVFSITALYQPWRAPVLNAYDVVSSILLAFIGICGLIFVSIEEEIGYAERLELWAIAARKVDISNAFAKSLTVLLGLFGSLFCTLLVWTLAMMAPSNMLKADAQHRQECGALSDLLHGCVKKEDFLAEAGRLISESTAYDRNGLRNFLIKMGVDPSSQSSGTSDTISINRAKQIAAGPGPSVVSA